MVIQCDPTPPSTPPATAFRNMAALDLFSGIGGFSLGLERAGMTVAVGTWVTPRPPHGTVQAELPYTAHTQVLGFEAYVGLYPLQKGLNLPRKFALRSPLSVC